MKNFNALERSMQDIIKSITLDVITYQNLDNDSFVNAATTWERVLNQLALYLTPIGASCIHVSEIPIDVRNAAWEYVRSHVQLTVV
jgi:hypothetical protein